MGFSSLGTEALLCTGPSPALPRAALPQLLKFRITLHCRPLQELPGTYSSGAFSLTSSPPLSTSALRT